MKVWVDKGRLALGQPAIQVDRDGVTLYAALVEFPGGRVVQRDGRAWLELADDTPLTMQQMSASSTKPAK